jgi:dolichol-phosphate mannosyltransferase
MSDMMRADPAQTPQALELSIIAPTFNEAGNVALLRDRIAATLGDVAWELIFVDDDSPDGTAAIAHRLAQSDRRVRCLLRVGRRGLVSAACEGILSSSSPLVAVIDADLQHDESLLSAMLEALLSAMLEAMKDDSLDIVVGSRYVAGGGVGDWAPARATASRVATRLSRIVLRADLQDPMSGFFMIRRDAALRAIRAGTSGVGFKILFDLFASSPVPLRHRELPYQFKPREHGESKLGTAVAWEFGVMLLDRLFGGLLPIRFIAFSLVGGVGLGVHLAVLGLLFKGVGLPFLSAQIAATLTAMTCNFLLNNVLTYRDMRLRGWRLLTGWASFALACSVGALANIGIANWLFERKGLWAVSALAGILVGAVWNYAVTSLYTWRARRA